MYVVEMNGKLFGPFASMQSAHLWLQGQEQMNMGGGSVKGLSPATRPTQADLQAEAPGPSWADRMQNYWDRRHAWDRTE